MIEKVKELDLPSDGNGGHSVMFVEESSVIRLWRQAAFVQDTILVYGKVFKSCVTRRREWRW